MSEVDEGESISKSRSLRRNVSYMASSKSAAGNISTMSSTDSLSARVHTKKPLSFLAERMVGQGAFGSVYLAKVSNTEERVAIKKVLQDVQYINRELHIMKKLTKYPHPFVIHLKQYFMTKENEKDTYLNLVLDYIPGTLHSLLSKYTKSKMMMPLPLVKIYVYQLARAMAHIHGLGITHRDLKPQNVLVDEESFSLKLCDFGSAKSLVPGEPNVAYICSRHYRAPELIFGSTEYSTAIDVWSTGCVMAELMLGTPLFPGCSAVDQIIEVMKVLGAPTQAQLIAMNPSFASLKLPNLGATNCLKERFVATTPPEAIDCLSAMFQYVPAERPPAIGMCTFPFFDSLREPAAEMPNGQKIPISYFTFTDKELLLAPSIGEMQNKLIPAHVKAQVESGEDAPKPLVSLNRRSFRNSSLPTEEAIAEGPNESLSTKTHSVQSVAAAPVPANSLSGETPVAVA